MISLIWLQADITTGWTFYSIGTSVFPEPGVQDQKWTTDGRSSCRANDQEQGYRMKLKRWRPRIMYHLSWTTITGRKIDQIKASARIMCSGRYPITETHNVSSLKTIFVPIEGNLYIARSMRIRSEVKRRNPRHWNRANESRCWLRTREEVVRRYWTAVI